MLTKCCLSLRQPSFSQHLKELLVAGLIQGEIETPKVRYCINRENWELARKLFTTFLGDCQCKVHRAVNNSTFLKSLFVVLRITIIILTLK